MQNKFNLLSHEMIPLAGENVNFPFFIALHEIDGIDATNPSPAHVTGQTKCLPTLLQLPMLPS